MTAMNLLPLTVRNFCPDNNRELLKLKKEKFSTDVFSRPGYSPEEDLFLAEMDGRIIGWINIIHEARIGRVVLNGFVHPDNRRQGAASLLFTRALLRARKLKAKVVHVCVPGENEFVHHFLSKSGFIQVRCYLELELDVSGFDKLSIKQDDYDFGFFGPGQEAQLAIIQNRCFKGSWGFCPNTEEEIKYYLELTDDTLKDVIISRTEDRIIGYCWTKRISFNERNGENIKGRIHMLGVDPDFRGKKIGMQLLTRGIHVLKEKGVKSVELTVDKKNAAACSLYKSLGFEIVNESFWYEKELKKEDHYL